MNLMEGYVRYCMRWMILAAAISSPNTCPSTLRITGRLMQLLVAAMAVSLALLAKQVNAHPGKCIVVHDVKWTDFQAIPMPPAWDEARAFCSLQHGLFEDARSIGTLLSVVMHPCKPCKHFS